MTRPARASALLALLPLLPALACGLPAGKLGDIGDTGDTGDTDPSDTSDTNATADSGESGSTELPPESDRVGVLRLDDGALDVLFVIDNSGSMGTEQARATAAIAAFAEHAAGTLGTDLRVGFTTTDNGNPWCGGTGPEAGNLRLSSCLSRQQEFVFNGASTIDVTQEACLDFCVLDDIPILPTTTHVDQTATERRWIEAGPGGTNLGAVSVSQAVSCAAPQGINGCGFEQPLESMHKSIERSFFAGDEMEGFLRPWARLAVVFVTDEVDCSYDPSWQDIFLPEGNRAFWGDPEAASPTSAVCWNASVECQGSDPDIGPCTAQNFDVDGNVTDASNAVMYSLTRYINELQMVESTKLAYRDDGSVSVALIAGVPVGYAEGTAELVYTRGAAGDGQFVEDFGVDPGCESPAGRAVPPVRIKALAELFPVGAQPAIHSICGDDYSPALGAISSALASPQHDTTACIPACVADTDPALVGTQPQCEIVMGVGTEMGRDFTLVPACDGGAAGMPCYEMRTDGEAMQCAAQGSNAELELVLPAGFEWQGQLTIEAACELAPAGSC
ncbi:hypothetical protein [Paraliomyxa miuraensis]|uniref:hypothetical protein n=1 Tax=Paraliomyxa miuraensis TaxID=376150 RepID=UPI0022588DFB|nr:hypothetical protein [Paraliomyxa miuraensis]MCX4246860.1 hypothetical protein [Paraliomyxa miuraensis]